MTVFRSVISLHSHRLATEVVANNKISDMSIKKLNKEHEEEEEHENLSFIFQATTPPSG